MHDYLTRCAAGTLYEHMMEITGTDLSRDDFKQHLFQEVFYRERHYPSRTWDAFVERYPSAGEMISHVMRHDRKRGADAGGLLSRIMQRLESDLVIRTMCQQIMTEHPEVPILTIHDSIGTTEEHAAYVRGIMEQAYSMFEISPSISVK